MINENIKDNKLILVVDDDASIRMTATNILEIQGYSAIEADSAEACLKTVKEKTPDLILLDAVMPGMDGFNCAIELRTKLGLKNVPIIMMTALDDRDSVYRSFDVGITDYLLKPLNWESVCQKIENLALTQAKTFKLKEQLSEMHSIKEDLMTTVSDGIKKTNGKKRSMLSSNFYKIA